MDHTNIGVCLLFVFGRYLLHTSGVKFKTDRAWEHKIKLNIAIRLCNISK